MILPPDFFDGSTRVLARTISRVESRGPESARILEELFPHTGQGSVLGVTGSPGVGKSSLVDRLASAYLQRGNRLAIVAVDPSSPFTGGAILGDRIRMAGLATHPDVFIRSMATRGNLGGLAAATPDVVHVLDAASRSPIIVETVGVGQGEVDIVRLADTSIVVLVPGMGDDVQAMKAGIMEIADIFVINKSDRPGVEKMERSILALLSLSHRADGWVPPIVRTVATTGGGVDDLVTSIDRHQKHPSGGEARLIRRRDATRQHLAALLQERLMANVLAGAFPGQSLDDTVERIALRELNLYSVVESLVAKTRFKMEDS